MWKKIVAIMMSAALLVSMTACGKKATTDNGKEDDGTYATKLFDQSYVHVVDIEISEADWSDLKTNPLNKTKYEVNVTIDGEKVNHVSFATKGNTSLTSIASDENSDRYSFKINFGKFEDGQTYYGLDKLNLNNIYSDGTYMKDYISYEIFRVVGVDAPLTSYVELRINGESFGLYLAIEDVDDSFLERTDSADSELYKPETEMLGNMGNAGGNGQNTPGGDFTNPDGNGSTNTDGNGSTNTDGNGSTNQGEGTTPPGDGTTPPADGNFNPGDNTTFPGGGFDMGNGMFDIGGSTGGGTLAYTDDKIDSYSDIFDNAVTKVEEEDMQRVIAALKNLSEGNISEALDVSEIIAYFVAHNFVMNYDSYTGSMLHNYFLKETDGKLSIIPWDYNLGFGAFGGGDATATVNCGIDTPLSGSTEASRPMWSWIVSNETYLNEYHEVYAKLIEYINSGKLEAEMERVYAMIRPYVEKDNSAFVTVSEFDKAYSTLLSFCKLRAESIEKQLSGQLSTKTTEQKAEDKVDASGITISDMGTSSGIGGGNAGGDMPGGNMPGGNNFPFGNGDQNGSENSDSENGSQQ